MRSAITVRDQDVTTAMVIILLTEEVEVAAAMVAMTVQEAMTTRVGEVKKGVAVDITPTTTTMEAVITMVEMAGVIAIAAEVEEVATDISLANATMIEMMAAIDTGVMTSVTETRATEAIVIITITTITEGVATIIEAVHRLINLAIRITIVNRWEFSRKGAE